MSSGKLVQKKVAIKKKDGSTYYAIRWVDPETEKAPVVPHIKYTHEDMLPGTTPEEKIQNVVHSETKPSDKARKLVSLGILNKKHLSELSGGTGYDAKTTLLEAGHNPDDYSSVNDELPIHKDTKNPVDLDTTHGQMLALSTIAEIHGDKEAFRVQKSMKEEIQKKLNLTIDDKWDSYTDDLEMLISGELGLRAVMGYGSGGVGKTYTLEEIILPKHELIEFDKELDMKPGGDEYDYVKIGGKIGSRELQRLMYLHRDKILIFDDCDSMWNDEGLINVLKNTLDTSGKGKTNWAVALPPSSKDADDGVPSSYIFSGRMIFITNLTKQELGSLGAGPIVESRCASTDLSMNLDQTLAKLHNIIKFIKLKDENRNELSDVTEEDRNNAFEAFTKMSHYGRIDQINTRVLIQMIGKARFARRTKGLNKEETQLYLEKQMAKQLGY